MNLLLTTNIRKYYVLEDSIEHDYLDYFLRLGFNPFLLANRMDFKYYFDNIHVDGVVLTGGIDVGESNNMSEIRDTTESKLLKYCIDNNIPVLGICRGLQMINLFFGGSLTKGISNHVRCNHLVRCVNPLFKNTYTPNLLVNSYHNHGVSPNNLSPDLEIVFQNTEDNLVEGIRHCQYPIFAIQWHPERDEVPNETVDSLIVNFFNSSNL
jgi:putative glutamine amidotransferase